LPLSAPAVGRVPRISFFYGIVIKMYISDHGPPHFHAIYGEYEASVAIDSLEVSEGSLPRRAMRLVREWGELHQEDLASNWTRARAGDRLHTIEPLR
jgi:hypothetical protein